MAEKKVKTRTKKKAPGKNAAKGTAKKKKNRILLFVVEVVLLVVLLAALYAVLKTGKVNKVTIDPKNIEVNEAVKNNETLKGYRNIALFGVDARDGSLGKGNRTDTIMVASINLDTGEIKLVSVYRDTYLNLGNDQYNKCNAAYAKGGPEQAINMLNMNLDLNIEDYITIGFSGLEKAVDALGGVEINILESEIRHLNNYQISMVGTSADGVTYVATEGKDYTAVTSSGLQTLNGLQATAYCRVRQVGDDFMRAERQREVLTALMEKAQDAGLSALNEVLDEVLPYVSTSLDVDEMVEVLGELAKYQITDKDGFPYEEYRVTGNLGGSIGSSVIPADLNANVVWLHEFLFETEEYQLSDEVQKYSRIITQDTGY